MDWKQGQGLLNLGQKWTEVIANAPKNVHQTVIFPLTSRNWQLIFFSTALGLQAILAKYTLAFTPSQHGTVNHMLYNVWFPLVTCRICGKGYDGNQNPRRLIDQIS